jgi:ATP-dependent exoDNAse (exonuclease V) beta subunit
MNSDRIRVLVGVSCVLASIVTVWVLQRQTSELRQRIATLEASAKDAANAPAAPRVIERVIVREPSSTSGSPAAAPAAPARVDAAEKSQARAQGPEIVRTKDEVSRLVASRFVADPPDRSRAATEALNTISSAIFEREAEGVHLQSLECHERLCRAELEFRDEKADRSVMNSLFRGDRQLRMGGAIVPDRVPGSDGHVLATLYIARTGEIELE